jgi:hypothetical protein
MLLSQHAICHRPTPRGESAATGEGRLSWLSIDAEAGWGG